MTLQKDIFVFIGPPGSGKGTISQLCNKELGWRQFSTGDACRKNIAERTEIGKLIAFALKSGKLVSDGLITQMVDDWFINESGDAAAVILDGYPRTVAQAEAFRGLLEDKFNGLKLHVVRFSIPHESVIERLASRWLCSNSKCQVVYSSAQNSTLRPKKEGVCDKCGSALRRRADDEKEAVRERLKIYDKHENALLSFYRDVGQSIHECNANQPLPDVLQEFKALFRVGVE